MVYSSSPPTDAAQLALHAVLDAIHKEARFLRNQHDSRSRHALCELINEAERISWVIESLDRDAMTRAACIDSEDE